MRVGLFGGTGFVGSYLVEALLAAGHEPSVLVRAGSESKLARRERCRVVRGDLDAAAAIRETLEDCQAVIYNVGILRERPAQGITFERLQYQGAVDVVEAARAAGIERYLLMSANGVKASGTPYQTTKHRAEQALRESGLKFTIFRPSVIFGDPNGRMEFASQLHRDMVAAPLPAVNFQSGLAPGGEDVVMSPVAVEDVADAFIAALADPATIGGTYPLGGPEVLTWGEIIQRISAAAGKRKWMLPMPIGIMRLGATLFDWLPFFPVTRDQLSMLAEGNTVDPGPIRQLIGREPRAFTVDALAYLSD